MAVWKFTISPKKSALNPSHLGLQHTTLAVTEIKLGRSDVDIFNGFLHFGHGMDNPAIFSSPFGSATCLFYTFFSHCSAHRPHGLPPRCLTPIAIPIDKRWFLCCFLLDYPPLLTQPNRFKDQKCLIISQIQTTYFLSHAIGCFDHSCYNPRIFNDKSYVKRVFRPIRLFRR